MKSTLRVLVCALLVTAVPGAFAQTTGSDVRVGAIEQFHAWRNALTNAGYTLTVENALESKNRKDKRGRDNGKMFNGFGDDLTFSFTAAKNKNVFNLATTYHYGDEPDAKKNNYADNIDFGYGYVLKNKKTDGYGLIVGVNTRVYFDEQRQENAASVRLMPSINYVKSYKNKVSLSAAVKFPYFFKHTPKDGQLAGKTAFGTDFDIVPAYNFSDKFALEVATSLKNRQVYKANNKSKKYVGRLDLQVGVRYAISPRVNIAPYLKAEKVVGINTAAAHNALTKPAVGFNLTAQLL
ncbi:MAG: hypothetical protein J6Y94_00135 [Bacteriovoracaceae bacterium]|nr:hypothetical protein [Bacteriovoracaceae bacterium]